MSQKLSSLKSIFLDALHKKRKVLVRFYSIEDGAVLSRVCAPMDYGPSRRSKDPSDRFHLWDFSSDIKAHTLSLKLDQIVSIELLPDTFDPSLFVTWKPNWIVPRDWGHYS